MLKFEYLEHSHKGLVREVNEDNHGHALQTSNGDIFVVCDGMGGHVGGQTASTIGVSSLLSNLSQPSQGNMHVAVSDALVFANEQVLGHGETDPSLKGMGSTATVALFKDDLLYIGNVGDSRAYLFSDGKLFRLTKDDSYVQGLIDNGTITEDEAEVHPHRNRILQALGSKTQIKPRIPNKPFKLKKGDVLMLCSDGLTSMVQDELIEQFFDPNNLSDTVNKLHDIAMANGGKDNITITLVRITESPFPKSEFEHHTQKYKTAVQATTTLSFESTIVPEAPVKKSKTLTYVISIAATLVLGFGLYTLLSPKDQTQPEINNPSNESQNQQNNEPAKQKYNNSSQTNKEDDKQVIQSNNQEKDKPSEDPCKNEKWYKDSLAAQKELDEFWIEFPPKQGTIKGPNTVCNDCEEEKLEECKTKYKAAKDKIDKANSKAKQGRDFWRQQKLQ
jgi:protein phosphatase